MNAVSSSYARLLDALGDWRETAILALAAAITALALAFVAQHGFGLIPCELCVWQRWPYVAAIAFGGLALILGRRDSPALTTALLGLAAASFAVGAGIGVFHSGVEFQWWDGLASCAGAVGGGESFAEFWKRETETPTARCGDRADFFLGLSMANWNVLYSAGAAALFAWSARLRLPAAGAASRATSKRD